MSKPEKIYQLNFCLEHLEHVTSGKKTCTVRVSDQLQYIKQGSLLNLLPGRRDCSKLIEA